MGDGLKLGLEVVLAKNGHLAVLKAAPELLLHVDLGTVHVVHSL